MALQGSCGFAGLMSCPPASCSSSCPLLGSGVSFSTARRPGLAASRSSRKGRLRLQRCTASQSSENPADSLRAGFSQLWSNISRSARNSLDSLRGAQPRRQAPSQPQPQQASDATRAAQESTPQAANQQSEQDSASASDSEEEHEREAYVLSEGGLDEDMESISFTIEELPEGMVASEYMPGAFQAVDMDSVDPSEALQLTVPALPDLAILADNKAPMSWEDWYQHVFMHKDRAAHRMEQLQSALENAVQGEMYEDAAEYSADLARHAEWDDVDKILDEYTEAIKTEDFQRAAALRDEGGAGLIGWWVANPAPEDPQGHLLRVQPSFGRYLGMTFTARDIATSQGLAVMVQGGGPQGSLSAGPMPQGMEMVEEGEEVSITHEGTPCMEVWVQRNEDGTFNRQTTLLRPPLASMGDQAQPIQEMTIVTVGDNSDDSTADSIPQDEAKSYPDPQPSGSEINPEAMSEARRVYGATDTSQTAEGTSTSEEEAGSETSDTSSSSEAIQPGESVISNEASGIKGKLPARPRRQRRRSRPASGREDPPQGSEVLLDQMGNSWQQEEVMNWLLPAEAVSAEPDIHEGLRFGGAPLQNIMNLIRHPATLTSLGRHQLVIKADEKLTAQEKKMAEATRSLAGQLAAGQQVPLHLTIHNRDSSEVETMDFSGAPTPEGKDPIEQMTEQVMKAMQRHAQGQDPPPEMATKETLTDIIRTATMEFLNQASNSTLGSNGQMTYTRLDQSAASTDPFCGTFLGSFGGNGPELLQVTRTTDKDGDEAVVATKLTGDPNVPAGQVSFKAKITRSNKISSRDIYPPELGVVGRYRGQGRIAKAGHKEARWVDGELLRFASSNPATHGAELGFVWLVPQDKRYLVLLNKVELDDPMQEEEEEN